jgi:hypothetical protein
METDHDRRRRPPDDDQKRKWKNAGIKAAETKGPDERKRAAKMAAWTRKHGKNDEQNPYTRREPPPRVC